MSATAPQWDAFQRVVLEELGLRPQCLAATAPASANAGACPDALLDALARAVGCPRDAIAELEGLDRLRGDARAKRALWPRLRKLRAEHRVDSQR